MADIVVNATKNPEQARLKHWVVTDVQWSQSAKATSNLDFLRGHGCCARDFDGFALLREIPEEDIGVFVLSNLNPRGYHREFAMPHGINLKVGSYYRMLFNVLRTKAPMADVVVLARQTDGVMEDLMSVATPWFVQLEAFAFLLKGK